MLINSDAIGASHEVVPVLQALESVVDADKGALALAHACDSAHHLVGFDVAR